MGEIRVDIEKILKNVFAISLASKNIIRRDVDLIFDKDKLTYLKYYKNSNIYKTVLNQSLSFEVERYTEKIIGIIEYCLDTNNIKDIENLYKKAFKKIYINTKNFKKINIYNIANYLSEGIEGTFEVFTTLYIAHLNNKVDMDDFNDEILLNSLKDIIYLESYIDTNFSNDTISLFKTEIVEIRNKFGIKKKMYTLEELITDILSKDVEDYNKNIIAKRTVDIQGIQKVGNIGKYIGALEGTFKYLQIDSARLAQNTTFTQTEINKIILNFIFAEKFNNFSDKDLSYTIIFVMYITALNKEYKKLKNDYLRNINDEHLIEIDNMQQDLISSKNEFDRLSEKTKIREQLLIAKEHELIDTIESLKKENQRLQKQLKETDSLKQEVIKLRNIVFNSEFEETDIDEIDDYIDVENMNKLNIVIVGGTITWVKKLKVQFPDWKYIGMEQLNGDFTNIKNSDFIFINTKMKHSLYFKIKNFIAKYGIKYDYLEPLENISINIKNIYMKLKSESLI